jgi:GAF domain-containing protein/HAMP domain-containing protein
MTIPDDKFSSEKYMNRNRRAIYTYRFAVLLALFAFINAVGTFIFVRQSGQVTWRTYAEGVAILIFVIIAISQARESQKNFSDRNVYILLTSFLGIVLVRDFFLAGLGLVFGIAAVSLSITIAILTLPTRRAGLAVIAGYIASAGIILLDYYVPYERIPAPPQIRTTITIAATAITIFAGLLIIQQFNHFSLYSKISILLSLAVLVPIIVIGILNVTTLNRELQARQNETLLGAATQAANSLDTFIQSTLSSLRMEGQLPGLAAYVQASMTGQEIDPSLRDNALRTLRTLAHKDTAFIKSYALLDANGLNILDSNPKNIGISEADSGAFESAGLLAVSYVSDVTYTSKDRATIVFAAPVRDAAFHPIGVIRVVYRAYKLQVLMSEYSRLLGDDSFAAILNEKSIFLAHGRNSNLIMKSAIPLTAVEMARIQMEGRLPPGTLGELTLGLDGMLEGLTSIEENPIFHAEAYPKSLEPIDETLQDSVAAITIDTHNWIVLFSQPQQAYLNTIRTQTRSTILVAVLILVIASIASLGIAQFLANPIAKLTRVANRIIAGDFEARADASAQDEIGILAETFNRMTSQVSDLIGSLETRVSERTKVLEKRANQLRAAADIGRLAASLHATSELLNQSVTLISERFGFYHVGLFLLDERREFAVLRAANSQGGQIMLSNNHRLRVGQVGIVGHVTARGVARIALDVGEDATYFDNPHLPDTRSEMALPLVAGGRVIGALDVQSTEGAAFSQDDVTTLQVLADLLTIAIENARLFEESQKALSTTQSYFGELSQLGWKQMIETRERVGYLATSDGSVSSISDAWDETLTKAASTGQIVLDSNQKTAAIPIVVRGQSVGAIRLQKPKDSTHWNKNDLDTAQVMADQLSAALESARLYQDAQRRALIEQAIGNISNRMDASPDVEGIMKTAVEEIGRLIGEANVSIHINAHEEDKQQDGQ